MNEMLTVPQAASKIGCSRSFLWKKCKDGILPSIRIGNEYRIHVSDLDAWVTITPAPAQVKPKQEASDQPDLLNLIDAWLSYITHVRALAPTTISLYQTLMRSYLRRMAAVGCSPAGIESLFHRRTILAAFSALPAKSVNTKQNTHIMLMSFGRFLIEEGKLDSGALGDLRALKPRRQSEPRRTHLKREEVDRLFDVILTRPNALKENLMLAAMVACMVFGGLRVSEVCNLRRRDVDLTSRNLVVRLGKGGKDRRVGISTALYGYLEPAFMIRRDSQWFFSLADGSRFDRTKLSKRMQVISRRLGVDITCHGLRRTFATLAANQGRSINSIRIALGHANLETTQAYLRTSEAEVVEAMKDW